MVAYTIEMVPFAEFNWDYRTRDHAWNPVAMCLIASVCAVTFWIDLEMIALVYATFKRRSGVYFWSVILSSVGMILQTTGYMLKVFHVEGTNGILLSVVVKIGWIGCTTGFSVVLWSRLHLVVQSTKLLRWLLGIIVANALIFHTPAVVCEFGMLRSMDAFLPFMQHWDPVQQTAFSIQETVLSGLYIYSTARFLNAGYAMGTRRVVGFLVGVQILVIALDAALTSLSYLNLFTLKCTVHPFVYSVKVRLEFIVLNQLLSLLRVGLAPQETASLQRAEWLINDLAFTSRQKDQWLGQRECRFITAPPAVESEPDTRGDGTFNHEVQLPSSSVVSSRSSTFTGGDESNVLDVLGRPDDLQMLATHRTISHDLERRYLGTYR
jgi:hypothetical protein